MDAKYLLLVCLCAVVITHANADWNDWSESWKKSIQKAWGSEDSTKAEAADDAPKSAALEADAGEEAEGCKLGDVKYPDKCNECYCDDDAQWDCTKEICPPW